MHNCLKVQQIAQELTLSLSFSSMGPVTLITDLLLVWDTSPVHDSVYTIFSLGEEKKEDMCIIFISENGYSFS